MVLVALTGWGRDEGRRESTHAGFSAHMVKPVGLAELTKLLAEFIAVASSIQNTALVATTSALSEPESGASPDQKQHDQDRDRNAEQEKNNPTDLPLPQGRHTRLIFHSFHRIAFRVGPTSNWRAWELALQCNTIPSPTMHIFNRIRHDAGHRIQDLPAQMLGGGSGLRHSRFLGSLSQQQDQANPGNQAQPEGDGYRRRRMFFDDAFCRRISFSCAFDGLVGRSTNLLAHAGTTFSACLSGIIQELLNCITCGPGLLLQAAHQLLHVSVEGAQVIVCQLTPFGLQFSADFAPISG